MNIKKEIRFRKAMEEIDGYYDEENEFDPFENI